MEYEELMDYLHHHGAAPSERELIAWTGRSRRTLQRWRLNGIPEWATNCIIKTAGLSTVKTANGHEVWRLQTDGNVTCPAGDTYAFSELRAAKFYKEAMKGYRVRMVALERELADIKKPSPKGKPAANDFEFLPNRSR